MHRFRFYIWVTKKQGDGGADEITYNFRYRPDSKPTYVGDHGMGNFSELMSEFARLAAQYPITNVRRKEISREPPEEISSNGHTNRPVRPDEITDDEINSLFIG